MEEIQRIMIPNEVPNELGMVNGFIVTGVNINGKAGIITITWEKYLFYNGQPFNAPLHSKTEAVTDQIDMIEFDAVTGQPTGNRTPAYSQWLKILKHKISGVDPEPLIAAFVLEKEGLIENV